MNKSNDSYQWWLEEKALLDELKAVKPEFFQVDKSSTRVLDAIGIQKNNGILPRGYLKYLPFDFIVEELQKDGSVYTVDDLSVEPSSLIEERTVYADLVKIGISTIEAVDRIAKYLGCDKSQISYAGIKDAVAITAQKISIRDVSVDQIKSIAVPQLFFKNVTTGKGVVTVGELEGNRFTIFIRTMDDFDWGAFEQKLTSISAEGLLNYYGPQRFGSPRYLSHVFGKYVLQGDFEKLVRAILVEKSEFEWPFVTQLRANAESVYGDWKKMKEFYFHLPHSFRPELELLDRLINWNGRGNQWIYALGSAPEQVDMWPKSYASYLVNKLFSSAKQNNVQLPDQIPLLLNSDPAEWAEIEKLYGSYLQADGTADFRTVMARLSYIRRGGNSYLQTKIFPKIINVKRLPEGVALCFELPKGAYATTLIYELFNIEEGDEALLQVSKKYIDTKQVLGVGSFETIYEWAAPYILVPFEK